MCRSVFSLRNTSNSLCAKQAVIVSLQISRGIKRFAFVSSLPFRILRRVAEERTESRVVK